MAEVYGILDYTQIPVRKLATLSAGLRDPARIVMKMAGMKITTRDTLLAIIADRLSWLCWSQSEDGRKGRNRPDSILELLVGKTESKSDVLTFMSGEEFEKERNRILSMIKGE